MKRFRPVRKQLEAYERSWKAAHDDAMRCLDFQESLAVGISLFHLINQRDEIWRLRVHRGETAYDPELEKEIEELYRGWLRPCPDVLKKLTELEKSYEVEGAEEFRRCCREAAGVLTPDKDFFSDDALVRLRDEAIESNRRGNAAAMESMGD